MLFQYTAIFRFVHGEFPYHSFLGEDREAALILFLPAEPKSGIEVKNGVVGKEIHTVTAPFPVFFYFLHQKA